MANTELKVRIVLCSKTASEWANDTTVILGGEFAVESDTRKIKIGDGKSIYKDLPYANVTPEEVENLIAESAHTHSNKTILDATTASFTSELLEKLNTIETGANKITVDSALSSTSTNPVQNKVVNSALDGKVPTTRTVNGQPLSQDVVLDYDDVGADKSGAASAALTESKAYTDEQTAAVATQQKAYTDTQIANLVDSAPDTMNTLKELNDAISEHQDVTDALNAAIGNKVDKVDGKGLSTNDLTDTLKNQYDTAYTHSQSAHAPADAEKNVIVGIQKNGTDLTVDSTTRKVNIAVPTKTSEITNDSGFITTDATVAAANKLASASKIDGVNFDGSADIIHYAECSTAASTAAKTASVTGFNLVTGSRVIIKFTNANTATTPTLNITGTGAKTIKYRGSTVGTISAGGVYEFVYDGTYWEIVGDLDENTVYTATDGITLSGTTFKHTNSVTAGTAQGDSSKTLTYGGTFAVPTVTYDAQGHITGKGTTTMTMPAVPSNVASATKLQNARSFSLTGAASAAAVSFDGTDDVTLNVTSLNAVNLYLNSSDTLILNGNF